MNLWGWLGIIVGAIGIGVRLFLIIIGTLMNQGKI